jgi:hypothetical protein
MAIVDGSVPARWSRALLVASQSAMLVVVWAFLVLVLVGGSWTTFLWGGAAVAVLGLVLSLSRSTREAGLAVVVGAVGGVLLWWGLAALWILVVVNG